MSRAVRTVAIDAAPAMRVTEWASALGALRTGFPPFTGLRLLRPVAPDDRQRWRPSKAKQRGIEAKNIRPSVTGRSYGSQGPASSTDGQSTPNPYEIVFHPRSRLERMDGAGD